jgi:Ras-related protein Rab-1A
VTSYFRGAHGVLFVYDVTDRYSFTNIRDWVAEVLKASGYIFVI